MCGGNTDLFDSTQTFFIEICIIQRCCYRGRQERGGERQRVTGTCAGAIQFSIRSRIKYKTKIFSLLFVQSLFHSPLITIHAPTPFAASAGPGEGIIILTPARPHNGHPFLRFSFVQPLDNIFQVSFSFEIQTSQYNCEILV